MVVPVLISGVHESGIMSFIKPSYQSAGQPGADPVGKKGLSPRVPVLESIGIIARRDLRIP
jgi:hypothetical protein